MDGLPGCKKDSKTFLPFDIPLLFAAEIWDHGVANTSQLHPSLPPPTQSEPQ